MKKFILLLILLPISLISQTLFESGYYIDNNGTKIDGLIKNTDWKNNPTEFEFKKNENDKPVVINIDFSKEFGVFNKFKFTRETVDIDRSSLYEKEYSSTKAPVFKKETLFLKNLVSGKANLFSYEDEGLLRFFISTDVIPIEQLVYKKYLITTEESGENSAYKQQLFNYLKCDKITQGRIERTKYFTSDLISIFKEYNQCIMGDSFKTEFEVTERKSILNINPRIGVGMVNANVRRDLNPFGTSFNVDYDSSILLKFGVELEYIFPFNNNKWALISEPSYQFFSAEGANSFRTSKLEYNSLDISLGARHYFFLKDKSKIFINASYHQSLKARGEFTSPNFENFSGGNLSAGIGYKRGKLSMELNQTFNRSTINFPGWSSSFSSTLLMFGYTLF